MTAQEWARGHNPRKTYYLIYKIKRGKLKGIRGFFKLLFTPKSALPPYRGKCAYCGISVWHTFPWWNKNPLKYKDAKPLHNECARIYLFSEE